MTDDISYAKIHPAIGLARLGNSTRPDGWFHGPETPEPEPVTPGAHKDDTGAIKRQAARFRIYGYDAQDRVVRELTTAEAGVAIEWAVHVANRKSAWYNFDLAFDIPDMAGMQSARRNPEQADRGQLVIDPGRRTLRAGSGEQVEFTGGTFLGVDVPLGRMHTDDHGRLVFLGGTGTSGAPNGEELHSFGNNDGWYDDTSDGPVTATLTLDGRDVPVHGAWVVVAPPNYAPDVKTPRTLWDLLHDVFLRQGSIPPDPRVNFERDVLPILRRFHELQWVNHGFAAQYGFGGPQDFLAPATLARLGSTAERHREARRQIWTAIRDHARDGLSPQPWPWFYGDAMASKPKSPLQYMTLSDTQIARLGAWAKGDFDTTPWPGFPRRLEDAPVADQPALLDRAALDFCLADAFHPGCEVTWPIRHPTMYQEPFRILHRPDGQTEPDYGPALTTRQALAEDGPLHAQGPGDLTRWMAIPWQTDTASCRSGYESTALPSVRYDPYVPTFWPARVPNHVLTEEDFRIVNQENAGTVHTDDEREDAFARRSSWLRGLRGDYLEQLARSIGEWHEFGIVETRRYTVGDGRFPATLQVESTPGFPLEGVSPDRNTVTLHIPETTLGTATHTTLLAATAAHTGYSADEIAVGYVDKLDPFGEESASGGGARPEGGAA